jgi:hypothetical protein
MKSKVDEHITSFISLKKDCLETGYIVRHRNYHEQFASMLKDFMRSTVQLKEATIKENDEDSANTLLAVECFCRALQSEMLMWLALKKEDPNKAWNYLVDAQDEVKASARAKYLERLQQEEYIEKLHQIEKVVFPLQTFTSPSYVIKSVHCSICKGKYGKCSHILGRAYMGRLCLEEVMDFEVENVAIVSYPFNKRARITEIRQHGKWKDHMTWKERRCPNRAEGIHLKRESYLLSGSNL